jgi:hypothetical protein
MSGCCQRKKSSTVPPDRRLILREQLWLTDGRFGDDHQIPSDRREFPLSALSSGGFADAAVIWRPQRTAGTSASREFARTTSPQPARMAEIMAASRRWWPWPNGRSGPSLCGNSLPGRVGMGRWHRRIALADAGAARSFAVDQPGIAASKPRTPTKEIIRLML